MGYDECPICKQNYSDCSCAVKNPIAYDECPICKQNYSDCSCAVKNAIAMGFRLVAVY
jgi:hypothetical protein